MKTTKTSIPFASLENGQLWEMKDSNVRISIVGKRLVHFKHFKGGAKRANLSITNKAVLEKYLETSKAVLVESQR